MRAVFTDEQELLAQTVTQLVPPPDPGTVEPGTDLPTDAWSALAGSGFTAVATPGRDGLGGVDVAIVCEVLGRHRSALPYIGSCLLPTLLLADAGADEALLDALAEGRRVAAVLAPDLSGPAAHGIAFDAAGADEALLVGADGLTVAPLAGPPLAGADLSRVAVAVPAGGAGERVAPPLPADATRWRTLGVVALCADMVGAMQGALDLGVAYACDRRQFGKPIGSFQAVQHLCADQLVRTEASRSITYHAAWAVDHLDPAAAWEAARTAKVFVGDAARAVTEATIQVHGGIGITFESEPHRYVRRVLVDRRVLGAPGTHLREAARRFTTDPASR